MFFGRRWAEVKRLFSMNKALSESFTHVRRDTGIIFQWLSYLYQQNQHQQKLLENLQQQFSQITYVPQLSKQDIQSMVEEHYQQKQAHSAREVQERIALLEKRIETLHERREKILQPQQDQISLVLEKIGQLGEKITDLKEKKQVIVQKEPSSYVSNLKEKILKKITRNSKAHVKQFIMDLLHKYDQASGLQLREIVVEEQGLCSKSSFYRLLQELEDEGKLTVINQGKEKSYLSKKEQIVEK